MIISAKQLESGFIRIQGDGPENWWQGHQFPIGDKELEEGFSGGSCKEFKNSVRAENTMIYELVQGQSPVDKSP